MGDFGISFLGGDEGQPGKVKRAADPYQEAVKVLSVRFPKIVGGAGLAPTSLLQSPGGAGSPLAHSAVQQALAGMAGLTPGRPAPATAPMVGPRPTGQPQMGSPMPEQPRPMAPPPRIIPGITSGDELARGAEFAPQQQIGTLDRSGQAGELLTAAERARRGYNPPAWGSGPPTLFS